MEQSSLLFEDEVITGEQLPVTLIKKYLPQNKINLLLNESQQYAFSSPKVMVFGKEHTIPRQQVWYANKGCHIIYSHLLIKANPFPHYLKRLCQQLNYEFDQDYNGVLVNRYQHGLHTMGWHCDDEPEIKAGTDIASVSLGAERDFIIKHKTTNKKYTFPLENGDLLIMHYPMQKHWLHTVPKRQRVTDVRLNFTFRTVIPNFHW